IQPMVERRMGVRVQTTSHAAFDPSPRSIESGFALRLPPHSTCHVTDTFNRTRPFMSRLTCPLCSGILASHPHHRLQYMRAAALLCAVGLLATGAATSIAQSVYSVNTVSYKAVVPTA